MQVEIKIDPSCTEPKVWILTDSITEEVERIVEKISENPPQILSGCKDDKFEVLEPGSLIRVYANAGKVFAVTKNGEYMLRLRLYDPRFFVRISNSEILNLKQIRTFDLSFTGTICVKLSDGTVSYVSRRYVPKIKKILGM